MTTKREFLKGGLTLSAVALLMRSVTLAFNAFITKRVGAEGMGLLGLDRRQGKIRHTVCGHDKGVDFTAEFHAVTEDGFRVNDPNSEIRSAQLWTYEQLENQIRNIWAISTDG